MNDEKYSYQNINLYCKEICDRLNVKLDDGSPIYFSQICDFLIQSKNFLLTQQDLNILDSFLKIPQTVDSSKDMIVDKIYKSNHRLPLCVLMVRIYIVGEVSLFLHYLGNKSFYEKEIVSYIRLYINEKWEKTMRFWMKNCCGGKIDKNKINIPCIKYSK